MMSEPFSTQVSLFRGKILSFVHVKSVNIIVQNIRIFFTTQTAVGERTGLVVRALDSGSGDPGSILGRVGVLFP